MKRRRKKSKKILGKRFAVFIISLLSVTAVFTVIMGIGGIFSVQEDEEDENPIVMPVDKETGKINVLMVGLDKGGFRTDTILIATYDLDENKIDILSIPRDTRMYVGGRYQKINCAYAISQNGKRKGINGTIEAVSRLTAIPINYYVEFTCDAFRKTIDALGGVDYDVPQNMNYDDPYQNLHIHLTKGPQHLDGDKAEQLVRFRKYPMGDIDRVKVQQNFMKALAEQKLNATILDKIPDIFEVIESEINTNFSITSVSKYLLNVADLKSENIKAYSLPGVSDSESYGASYWIPNMTELGELITNTFGYDASAITIHSADGSSISKDVKLTKPSEVQKKTETNKTDTKESNSKVNAVKEKKTDKSKTISNSKDTSEKGTDVEMNENSEEKPQKRTEEKIKRPKANPTNEDEE